MIPGDAVEVVEVVDCAVAVGAVSEVWEAVVAESVVAASVLLVDNTLGKVDAVIVLCVSAIAPDTESQIR